MEILLNILWLMLLAPALWLWRRRQISGRRSGYESIRFLICLGCILFLLFPVISASDDLHAMRAEMEEPGPSKRAVKQAGNDKTSSPWHGLLSSPLTVLGEASTFTLCEQGAVRSLVKSSFMAIAPKPTRPSRAPPFSSPA